MCVVMCGHRASTHLLPPPHLPRVVCVRVVRGQVCAEGDGVADTQAQSVAKLDFLIAYLKEMGERALAQVRVLCIVMVCKLCGACVV